MREIGALLDANCFRSTAGDGLIDQVFQPLTGGGRGMGVHSLKEIGRGVVERGGDTGGWRMRRGVDTGRWREGDRDRERERDIDRTRQPRRKRRENTKEGKGGVCRGWGGGGGGG